MSPWLSELVLRSQSDERLVSLARAGHDRAFAAIVQRYRPELFALARRLNSDGRAEDLLQQAFLNAFAALRSGADVKHVRGWLYQIVRNTASKSRPSTDVPLDGIIVAADSVDEVVQQRAKALSAMSELARLPERQRAALVGTALNGRAHADVALSMGVSEQAVRQLVHRARTTLRRAVGAVTPWPLVRWLATSSSGGTPAPEIAGTVGAISGTGVAVKLGALFAATGVFATGVVVGPMRHDGTARAQRAVAAHALGTSSAGGSRMILSGLHRSAMPAGIIGHAPATHAGKTKAALRPSPGTSNVSDRGRGTPSRTLQPGGATIGLRSTGSQGDDVTRTRHEGSGSPEGQDESRGSSSGAPEPARHDGNIEGASVGGGGRGSDDRASPTSGAAQSGASGSSGDGLSDSGRSTSLSDSGDRTTSVSATDTSGVSAIPGGSEKGSSGSGTGRGDSDSSSTDGATTEGH
jgi:RNA polymerase sigma factor (sigma-70 family)